MICIHTNSIDISDALVLFITENAQLRSTIPCLYCTFSPSKQKLSDIDNSDQYLSDLFV